MWWFWIEEDSCACRGEGGHLQKRSNMAAGRHLLWLVETELGGAGFNGFQKKWSLSDPKWQRNRWGPFKIHVKPAQLGLPLFAVWRKDTLGALRELNMTVLWYCCYSSIYLSLLTKWIGFKCFSTEWEACIVLIPLLSSASFCSTVLVWLCS